MAERLSTGFVNALNTIGSVKSIMANGVIHIYSGIQPATADATENGDLLMIITESSLAFTSGVATNGLNFGVSTNGVLVKDATETWSGIGLAIAGTGTAAGWFRFYANTVVTGASTTAVRYDGQIGTSTSYELQMSNNIIAAGGPGIISIFNYTQSKS